MMRRVAFAACLIAVVAWPAWATEFRAGSTVSVEPGEVIDDDLFVVGNSVLIAGRVTGDLFAAGQTVRLTGPVEGSVMAAGGDVRVTGDVSGSVRAAGQSVTVAGEVGRNATVAGESLLLGDTARVTRDLHAAGITLDLDGTVGRQARVAGQTATVRGQVGERLWFEGDEITLGPGARVGGDLVYRSPNEPEIAPGAVIGGKTEKLAPRAGPAGAPKRRGPGVATVIFFLVVFVFGVVGLAAAPRLFGAASNAMATRGWWNLLLGLIALVAVPVAAVIVCFTVVGIPLGILALVAWGAGLMFSGVPVGVFLGRWLMARISARAASPYVGLFVGLLLLTLVGFLPYIGWLTKLLTVVFGLGVYARAAKGVFAEMRAHPA